MRKYLSIVVLLSLLTLSFVPFLSSAERIEKKDVAIAPGGYKDEVLFAKKGDELDIRVRSDIPIDVYVISEENYNSTEPSESNFSNAVFTGEDVKTLDKNWTKPDDQTYNLVLHNDDNKTATVDYSYTDIMSEDVEEFFDKISMFCLVAVVLAIVVIVAIIVLIVVVIK